MPPSTHPLHDVLYGLVEAEREPSRPRGLGEDAMSWFWMFSLLAAIGLLAILTR